MTRVESDRSHTTVDGRAPVTSDRRVTLGHVLTRAAVVYAALSALMLAVGFTLTDVLTDSIGRWDEHVNEVFVVNREGAWSDITRVATDAVNTLPVVGAVAVICIALLCRRWFYEAAFVALAIALEIAVFLSTTYVVARPRPAVPRLNSTPGTGSFPSGHTAAATVMCVLLAFILTWHCERRAVRAAVWTIAVVVPLLIAVARVYRGLHHPTDVLAGLVLGIGCVVGAIIALRPWSPSSQ